MRHKIKQNIEEIAYSFLSKKGENADMKWHDCELTGKRKNKLKAFINTNYLIRYRYAESNTFQNKS